MSYQIYNIGELLNVKTGLSETIEKQYRAMEAQLHEGAARLRDSALRTALLEKLKRIPGDDEILIHGSAYIEKVGDVWWTRFKWDDEVFCSLSSPILTFENDHVSMRVEVQT